MGRYLLALMTVVLAGCATTVPQTVTITKTVPVYPPTALYDDGPTCQHAPARSSGTVYDLAQALASERGAVTRCMADRAALRSWAQELKSNASAK